MTRKGEILQVGLGKGGRAIIYIMDSGAVSCHPYFVDDLHRISLVALEHHSVSDAPVLDVSRLLPATNNIVQPESDEGIR